MEIINFYYLDIFHAVIVKRSFVKRCFDNFMSLNKVNDAFYICGVIFYFYEFSNQGIKSMLKISFNVYFSLRKYSLTNKLSKIQFF